MPKASDHFGEGLEIIFEGNEITYRHSVQAAGQSIGELSYHEVAGEPVGWETRYLHTDHLGSTSVVTDEGGTVLERFAYDAFGKLRAMQSPDGGTVLLSDETTRGFTGQRHEAGHGLYDYRARSYDPELGRFLQVDTLIPDLFDPQQLNPYSYVKNSPQVFTDSTGNFLDGEFRFDMDFDFSPSFGSRGHTICHSRGCWYTPPPSSSSILGWAPSSGGSGSAGPPPFPIASGLPWDTLVAMNKGWGSESAPATEPQAEPGSEASADTSGNWFERFVRSVRQTAIGEAGEVSGIINNPVAIIRGLYKLGKGLSQLALGKFSQGWDNIKQGAFETFKASVMLRSGQTSGLGHGWETSVTGPTGTKLHYASEGHDEYSFGEMANNSSIQIEWIENAWGGKGTELGVWGQAYRLYGTVGFGAMALGQMALGF